MVHGSVTGLLLAKDVRPAAADTPFSANFVVTNAEQLSCFREIFLGRPAGASRVVLPLQKMNFIALFDIAAEAGDICGFRPMRGQGNGGGCPIHPL